MKIAFVCRDKINIAKLLKKYNLKLDNKNPDAVISYGGDGTLLIAERLYPLVPKLPLKHKSIGSKCYKIPIERALEIIAKRSYNIKEHPKLVAIIKNKEF